LHTVDVVIDTGFTGDLTLRQGQISTLGLSRTTSVQAQLADGTIQTTDVYGAILIWDHVPIQVRVQEVETAPLLGTRLLAGHELKVSFVPGGAVTIEPIP
jgi:clan AA aspartic protease